MCLQLFKISVIKTAPNNTTN